MMFGCPLRSRAFLFLYAWILLALPHCESLSNPNPEATRGSSKPEPSVRSTAKGKPKQQPKGAATAAPRARGAAWSSTRNRDGYVLRRSSKNSSTTQSKKNRKRSPRWETEGDSLYRLIPQDTADTPVQEYARPEEERLAMKRMLREAFSKIGGEEPVVKKKVPARPTTRGPEELTAAKGPPPRAMWGSCSVGPVLRARLAADLKHPTPIQEAAFPVLSRRRIRSNAVIASPTGTGKTLAYLLPLAASLQLQEKNPYALMIVTPTVELARQIQKQANALLSSSLEESSPLCILVETKTNANSNDNEPSAVAPLLGRAPILVGTPRSIRQALMVIKASERNLYDEIRANLRTIVLDEADRLLRTEGAARERAITPSSSTTVKEQIGRERQTKRKAASPSPTELLLQEFPALQYSHVGGGSPPTAAVQLICVSATVGRALRRQVMALTNAPSMEKAAALVTADDRTAKGAARRRASLLPPTIRHSFFCGAKNRGEKSNDDKDNTKTSTAETKNDDESNMTVDLLWNTLMQLDPPAPALIFPGRAGVASVVGGLQDKYGFRAVQTLRDRRDEADVAGGGGATTDWKGTAVCVAGEKFGRGLDLDGVRYVILSSPPSSPAAYLHLAGRTGRKGQRGRAVTLVRGMKEAKLLSATGMALGIKMDDLEDGETDGDSDAEAGKGTSTDFEMVDRLAEAVLDDSSWKGLTKTALMKKTVAELVEYLKERGMSATDESGKRMLKADLVMVVLQSMEG